MQGEGLVLGYWAIRGLSERLRQILEFTGLSYTEERYTDADKWFQTDKPALIAKNPAVTLPYLRDGDKVITESDAIIVYVCHKAGKPELLGRNADEQVQIATVYGITRDLHSAYVRFVYAKYDENNTFDKAREEYAKTSQAGLGKLNALIGGRKFAAGDEITFVDFILADFLQTLGLLS
jgi:glutathione S-transferase